MAEDELYVVTNAGPIESVTERICGKGSGAEHVSYETAKIDIQGPEAQRVALAVGFEPAKDLKYFQATWTTWEDFPAIISRTGYTGELGYELYVPNALAVTLWNRLLEIEGVEPAGLGARDTLRTEVGYALSGQDFDENITPLEAGMESFIAWDTNFVGRQALEEKRQAGDARALVGIVTNSKRKPQHGFEVFDGDRSVGEVTSGTFGPSIGTGVGLARVNRELGAPGTKLTAGPKNLEIEVIEIPAYRDGTARKKL
jgi:aminomethyltransferase